MYRGGVSEWGEGALVIGKVEGHEALDQEQRTCPSERRVTHCCAERRTPRSHHRIVGFTAHNEREAWHDRPALNNNEPVEAIGVEGGRAVGVAAGAQPVLHRVQSSRVDALARPEPGLPLA